jgi:hypothetical protein
MKRGKASKAARAKFESKLPLNIACFVFIQTPNMRRPRTLTWPGGPNSPKKIPSVFLN